MKTAMQELIDKIEKMVSIRNFQQWEQLKKEFLAKEKQDIIDAYAEAYLIGEDLITDLSAQKAATNYFTQKYKQQ